MLSETEWQRCFGIKGKDGERATELSFLCEVKQTWLAVLDSPHMTTIPKKERVNKGSCREEREREITRYPFASAFLKSPCCLTNRFRILLTLN